MTAAMINKGEIVSIAPTLRTAYHKAGEANLLSRKDGFAQPAVVETNMKTRDKIINILKRDGVQEGKQLDVYSNATRDISMTLLAANDSTHNNGFVCVAMRGRNKSNPSDHRSYPGIEYEQRIEVQNHDTTNTLTSVQKDNMIMQVGNISDSPHNPLRTRVYSPEGDAPTLTAARGTGGGNEPKVLQLQPRYRIRKFTERECFRLMGVDDADIDTIQASGVSRSAQYKMAGNSIVVDVLYHIFRQAFTDDLDISGAVVETIKVDVQQLKLF